MEISSKVAVPEIPSHSRSFGKSRLIALLVLLILLILCATFAWTTRDAMAHLQFLRAQRGSGNSAGIRKTLVDQRPWQTIQALAPLAVSAEETEYAQEAERLADHEVDQAFASAMRLASLQAQRRTLTGDALALSTKVTQLKQLVKQDRAQIAGMTPKPADVPAKNGAQTSDDSDDLEMAKAQLELDSDELNDAQQELDRASGDNSTAIKEELTAHEAVMRQYDSKSKDDGQVAILSAKSHRTLAERISTWFSQRSRYQLLQQAQQETESDIGDLTAEYNALVAKAKASASAPPKDETDRAAHLASVREKSTERQVISIYDDRIQTERQLASVYGKWSVQVQLQHRILLHLILQSLAFILLAAICTVLGDALVRHLTARPEFDPRQAQTLRSVLELSVQIAGVGIILLMIFGYPRQTPTILGLATAALTIALQDFILAFLGWFVIVGKNGIHVGDRVEINGVNGEVTEVGLFHTTMLETGNESGTGHLTGRRITFINSFAIRGQYFNFTTSGQWMWDEITVSIPANQDVHAIAERIQKAVLEETEESARTAKQEMERGARGESLRHLNTASVLSLRPSSSGIDLEVRFITRAFERIEVRNRIFQRMIDLLHA